MLGRQVTVALRRPLQARLRTQTRPSLCIRTFTQAPALLLPAGKPKKTVGEPSKPVKRAVKTAAKKKTDPEAAAKKLAAKQKAAEKKKAQLAKKKVKRTLTPKQVEKKKAALGKKGEGGKGQDSGPRRLVHWYSMGRRVYSLSAQALT